MLEITALPARQGDAIWIRWGDAAAPHQMFVDMGTEATGTSLRERFVAMDRARRRVDLLVITHVDADHIGGVISCLAEADPLAGLEIDDVWFNGFEHLSGGKIVSNPKLEPMGPAQGERFSNWLRGQKWNRAFEGGPVWRDAGGAPRTVKLHDDLELTVLGPTPDRLTSLIETWEKEVARAIESGKLDPAIVAPGLEPMGSTEPPVLMLEDDLELLADSDDTKDRKAANGSSIVLLLEYEGHKVILSGDAFSDDVLSGIQAVSPGRKLRVDLFKVPHHGSKKNIHRTLVEAVDCQRWLVSTDGSGSSRHPDAEAIARVVSFSSADEPLMSFNVRSTYNGWWDNQDWRALYGYRVEYGDGGDGLTIQL